MRTRPVGVIGIAALLALGPAGPLHPGPQERAPRGIRIVDFAFRPADVIVVRGTRVGWRNDGPSPHTSTSQEGLWDSGILNTGETFVRRFDRVGAFPYFCAVHPEMQGRVRVRPASPPG